MNKENSNGPSDEQCDAIDDAFKKEIGMSISSAIKILHDAGIRIEDAEEISNRVKDAIT